MKYHFNENTLLHTCGFDILSFISIMQNGIVSKNYADKNNILYVKNYEGANLNDTISCVRALYINEEVEYSSYNMYIKNGISFIIENTPFIFDKQERIIHRADEVLVEDHIPTSKITGIILPEEYIKKPLQELPFIRTNVTSYPFIKRKTDNIRKKFSGNSQNDNYNDIYNELYYINLAYEKSTKEEEKQYLQEEYKDVITDLNELIGNDIEAYFKTVLNKEEVNIYDIVDFINKQTLNLEINILKNPEFKRKNTENRINPWHIHTILV